MPKSRIWLAIAVAACAAPAVHAATTDVLPVRAHVFRAITNDPNAITLNGSKVVPPTASAATGTAILRGNQPFTALDFNITHDVAGETGASIRGPAYANENGGLLFALPLGSPKIGTWNFSPAEAEYILAGQTYIVIQSGTFPGGEIRGQISASNPPVDGQGIWVRVLVQNLGPDIYVGTGPGKGAGPAAVGRLQVSVDIEEPTKPTKPGLDPRIALTNVTKDFAVTIAPFDTVEVDLGFVPGYTAMTGTLTTLSQTTAQSPNVDPNPSNDQRLDYFYVPPVIPAAGLLACGVAAAALAGTGARALRRRRGRSTD
jgi:hypothetical protein